MRPVDRSCRYKSSYIDVDSDSSLQVNESDSKTSDESEDQGDPQFRAYMDYLRKTKSSFDLEIFYDDCEAELTTYEAHEQETARSPKNLENLNKDTTAIVVKKNSRKSSKKNVQVKVQCKKAEVGNVHVSRSVGKLKESQTKDLRGKNVNWASVDAVDVCYRHFLNNMHMEGGCVVYVYGGKRVIYEKHDDLDDGELSSDVEIIERGEMGNIHFKPPQSNISHMDGDEVQWIPDPVQFRKNLIKNLKRPYDQEEYEDFWDRVNQKITRRDKLTKKGNRKDELEKSYLESYKDLEAQLLAVQFQRPKKLNILRGFFYWLLNERENGAFKPWKDPVCLAVMPGSK